MGKLSGFHVPGLSGFFNTLTSVCIDKKDARGETRLYKAVHQGSTNEVKKLLRAGADPDIANNAGLTPLHQAAYWGETEIVELLLKAGAEVKKDNGKGWTPLHSAAVSGGRKARGMIIALLEKAGACDEIKDTHGWTPKDYMLLWEQNAAAATKLKDFLGLGNTAIPENTRRKARGPKLS